MLIISHLCDAVTSCHDVTKLDSPISASRCDRKLILFCSMVFQVTEFKNINDFSFVGCRDDMTPCHDVTKTV